MVKLAANLSTMFTEAPLPDRFALAAEAGFAAVEMQFPYAMPAEDIAALLRRHDLVFVLLNIPAGDWAGGDRGLGALPGRVDEFRSGVRQALDYARVLGCPRLHLMAGMVGDADRTLARRTLVENIRHAADLVSPDGIQILLEPLNSRVDMPGYFYDSTEAALDVIREAGAANVRLQYDIYHMQIMEGDLARSIERLLPSIGHIQLADNPGRGEPGTGEINFPWLLDRIDRLGYDGHVGCEYTPVGRTQDGLGWSRRYLEHVSR